MATCPHCHWNGTGIAVWMTPEGETNTDAEKLADINERLRAVRNSERDLLNEARPLLLGKHVLEKEGGPVYEISRVMSSGAGNLSIEGRRVRNGKAGDRVFFIGLVISCKKIWTPEPPKGP